MSDIPPVNFTVCTDPKDDGRECTLSFPCKTTAGFCQKCRKLSELDPQSAMYQRILVCSAAPPSKRRINLTASRRILYNVSRAAFVLNGCLFPEMAANLSVADARLAVSLLSHFGVDFRLKYTL